MKVKILHKEYLSDLEDAINAKLKELESCGKTIVDVKFAGSGDLYGSHEAMIIYK